MYFTLLIVPWPRDNLTLYMESNKDKINVFFMKGFSATSSIRPVVDLRLNGGIEILIFSLKYFESL